MKLRVPWSVEFVRAHAGVFTLGSAWRYRSAVARGARGRPPVSEPLRLRVRRPPLGDIWVRDGTSDLRTLDEVVCLQLYRPVCETVPGCRRVIDMGGNIGLAARYFAAAYPDCRILSVEPDERNQRMYRRNMSQVDRSRWELLPAAVWRANEPVALGGPPAGDEWGLEYDAIRVSGAPAEAGGTVPGLTPAEVIRRSGFDRVDLLKIDIEGAEVHLFDGDRSWLDAVATLAIEFHDDSRQTSGFDAHMSASGFTVRTLNKHTVLASRPESAGRGRP